MNSLKWLLIALIYPLNPLFADAGDPVKVFGRWKDAREKTVGLELGLDIQEPGFLIYKDSIKMGFPGHTVMANVLPPGEKKVDKFTQKVREVYSQRVHWPIQLERDPHAPADEVVEVEITYRACNDITCHFPKLKRLHLSAKHPEQHA